MVKQKGFSLLEIIIVMGLVAVLSAAVFFYIKADRKTGQSQNAVRTQDCIAIEQAIKSCLLDNDQLPAALSALTADTYYSIVVKSGSTSGQYTCDNLSQDIDRVDIASVVEPYIGNLPVDPEASGDDTGYYIIRRGNLFDVGNCNSYQFCGDGACNNSENASTCAQDCPASCGDGYCTGIEDANNCSADCPDSCGDGYCTGIEDCSSCETDCGACASNSSPIVSDAGRYPSNTLSKYMNATPMTWSAWTDPDGDTVEYYLQIWENTMSCAPGAELENSGWITATSYNIIGTIYTNWRYSWQVKGRSQGLDDETVYNTCYYWVNADPKASCPFVYLWDGEKYNYLTDIKGQNIGFPPDHNKAKKTKYYIPNEVPLAGFKSEDGIYKLKFRESLKEMDYFDELKLMLVDHPKGYEIISSTADDRLTFESAYQENKLYTVKDPRLPISAIDQDGQDVLSQFSSVDNISGQDYANPDSYVELDFGNLNPKYAKLVIDGWSVYQLARPSHPKIMPYVETINADGQWEKVNDFGFISGDFKTIAVDLSNKFATNDYRIRVHFGYSTVNAMLFDRIRIDDSEPIDLDIHAQDVSTAKLYHGGFDPYEYASEDHRTLGASDASEDDIAQYYFYGNFTRYGDVKKLLDNGDDMFVIFRHGDALDVTFHDIAPPQEGYERTPVLYADVFYKIVYEDNSGKYGTLEDPYNMYPLPFKNMSQYPYDASIENYPDDQAHQDYLKEWNTRICQEGKDYCYDAGTGYRILYKNQKEELDRAYQRMLDGNASKADMANIDYAKKYYGYSY